MSRKTGPLSAVVEIVLARSGGDCEVVAGPSCLMTAHQIHHRRARGMGGSRKDSTNQPSNLLHVCWACHAHIESQREKSLRNGWLVPQAQEPVEVLVTRRGRQVLLDNNGHAIEQGVMF